VPRGGRTLRAHFERAFQEHEAIGHPSICLVVGFPAPCPARVSIRVEVLWETCLNDVPSSCPITYSLNGNGGAHAATWPPLVPEIKNPPGGGAELWVFELPGKTGN
jgi:hypothetical protein